jgi:iron complex outermembrane receptor protein
LLASHQDARQSDPGTLPTRGTLLPNPNGEIPRNRYPGEPAFNRFDTQISTASYFLDHAFSDQLKASHKLRYYRGKLHNEFSLLGAFDGRTLLRQSRLHRDETSVLTSDTSLQWDIATGAVSHKLLFGIDHVRSEYTSNRMSGSYPAIDIFNPVYTGTRTLAPLSISEDNRRQLGFYLQDQIKIGPKWVVLVGGRRDSFDNESVTVAPARRVANDKQKATTARAGVVYLADNGLAPYASYSESFNPTGGTDRAGNLFEPDAGRQYEVGVRYQPTGADYSLAGAIYDLTRSNVLSPDPFNPGFSVSTGGVRSRGLELEAKGRVTRSLSIIAAYSYTDTRIERTTVPALVGSRLSNSPYHAAALFADLNLTALGVPNLVVGAGLRYVSEKPGSLADNTTGVPGYTLMDARVAYETGPWRYAMNFFNLLDKRYIPSACVSSGVRGCDYGEPRRVTASVTYLW